MPFGGMLTASLIGAGGSVLGGIFGNKASGQYIKMLKQAQQWLQGQEQLGLQNYQPYLRTGQTGAGTFNTLANLLGTPGQGLLTPWTQQFTAPTAAQAAQTPGYQFQLQQGLSAMQNSAAGKGSLLSGRTLADLNNYAQGVASTNYQNTFNNALTQYQSAYQTFLNNQQNQYQRLLGTSQLGLGTGLGAAQGAGNLISGIGGDIASLLGQQGAAQAGGTMALGQGIGGAFNDLGQMFMLRSLLGGSGGNTSYPSALNTPGYWNSVYSPPPSTPPFFPSNG